MIELTPTLDVSRETHDRLRGFCDLTVKWTARINLIAPGTVADIWQRHVLDSAQLYQLAPQNFKKWADLGSGGGFPGLIIAILAKESNTGADIVLIESDLRKATFLRTAVRQLGLDATVISQRIESTAPQAADVVSARALAPLPALLPHIQRHGTDESIALLPKGRNHRQELHEAQAHWSFTVENHDSFTDPDASILAIQKVVSHAEHS